MSKGLIVSYIGEGKYRVSHQLATGTIQEEISQIETRIAELAVELPQKKVELIQAKDAVSAKTNEIDSLIPDLMNGVEGASEEISRLQAEAIALQGAARKLEFEVSSLISEDLSLKKRRGQLAAVETSRDIEAWCADYTEDLSGEVGIIDVNDQGGQGAIIEPGFEGAAAYSAARDGALFPNLAQSARQIFFNAAIMPGVQKWLPRYRVGTILSVDGDICSVELDAANSSIQGLPINEQATLADVPIMYMDCNGLVFEEDDRVVVRFTQNGPLVVGFESEPKQCGLDIYVMDADYGVLRMSADMHTVKDVIVPGSLRLREFAVTDDKFMIVYERGTTYEDPDSTGESYLDSRIIFLSSGYEFTHNYVDPSFEIKQVAGANSNYFLLELNDGSSETSYAEIYDLEGNYVRRVSMTPPGMDFAIYPLYHLPANDEYVLYSNLNIPDGFYAISQTDLLTGATVNYFGGRSETSSNIFVTKNRMYFLQNRATSIEIYNTAGDYIGAWPFTITAGGAVTSICVTRLKGYVFSFRAFSIEDGPGYSEVAVFSRDGDTFTLDEVVNLKLEHDLDQIPKSMPDMKKLLELDA